MKIIPKPKTGEYVPYSGPNNRELEAILEEFVSVRRATLSFFSSLDEEALTRVSVGASKVMSVRAAAYHIAGHELHHLNSIKENYI